MTINFYRDFKEWAKATNTNANIIEQYEQGFFTMFEALRLLCDENIRKQIEEERK